MRIIKIVIGRRCPECDRVKCRRIQRLNWMYYVPFCKHYSCKRCGFTFISIMKIVSIRLKKDPKLKRKKEHQFTVGSD